MLRRRLLILAVLAVALAATAIGLALSAHSFSSPAATTAAPAAAATPREQAIAQAARDVRAQDAAWWKANGRQLLAFWVATGERGKLSLLARSGRTAPAGAMVLSRTAFEYALTSTGKPPIRNTNDLLAGAQHYWLNVSMTPTVGALEVWTPQAPNLPRGSVALVTSVTDGQCVAVDMETSGKVIPQAWRIPCQGLVGRYFVS